MSAHHPFHRRWLVPACALSFLLAAGAVASDWPQYRGPNRDGIAADRLNRQWTGAATNPVWRIPVTNCLGSLVVSGGRLFTQTRRFTNGLDREVCVALNATTGAELWAVPVDVADYTEGGVGYDDGPRTTPAVDGDSVFVWTSYFKLYRLNVTNGAIIWQKDLMDEFGSQRIGYQNAASPVIENGLLHLNAWSPASNFMAFRTTDGSLAWRSERVEGLTHSTPTLATIHGVRQIVYATWAGLLAFDPLTGVQLWRRSYPFNYGTSIGVSPVVHSNMIFICGAQEYNMGSFVWAVTYTNGTWGTTQLWANLGFSSTLAAHWMTPVARDGFLYGQFGVGFQFDSPDAQLKCVEMRTGNVKWSVNGFGRCATILVDDDLVSLTERGQLVLVRAQTNSYSELGRFTAIPGYVDAFNKCWNCPAVSDGRLFVRSTMQVAQFDLSIPALKFDAPRFSASNSLDLSIRTVSGAPVTSNRFTNLQLRTAPNATLALTQWSVLTNSLVLTGGVVRVNNVGTGTQTQRFFIVSEPK